MSQIYVVPNIIRSSKYFLECKYWNIVLEDLSSDSPLPRITFKRSAISFWALQTPPCFETVTIITNSKVVDISGELFKMLSSQNHPFPKCLPYGTPPSPIYPNNSANHIQSKPFPLYLVAQVTQQQKVAHHERDFPQTYSSPWANEHGHLPELHACPTFYIVRE
jgi:hypothetical protein